VQTCIDQESVLLEKSRYHSRTARAPSLSPELGTYKPGGVCDIPDIVAGGFAYCIRSRVCLPVDP